MKPTKLVPFLLFLVFLVFLVSCNSSPEDVELQDFKTGIFEVELNLLDNAPPDKIYPNSNFKIVADVHNMAGYDISPSIKEKLQIKIQELQQSTQPKYIEKVHYVCVNSFDRDWINSSENRYSYQVKFNQNS